MYLTNKLNLKLYPGLWFNSLYFWLQCCL